VSVIHLLAKLPEKEGSSIDDAIQLALERKQLFADTVTGDTREVSNGNVADIRAVLGT
jgi:hypothetical protein